MIIKTKKLKATISAILTVTIMLGCISFSALAEEVINELEPISITLIGDSLKFSDRIISPCDIEKQSVNLIVNENATLEDLETSTDIIVDKESYDNMTKLEKREINDVLKSELNNNKEIIFIGDENYLNLSQISENLDVNLGIEIEKLDPDSFEFATSLKIENDGKTTISLYNCNYDESSNIDNYIEKLSEIITTDFDSNDTQLSENSETIQTQILATNAVEDAQKIIDYNVKSSGGIIQVIVRTVMDLARIGVKNPNSSNTTSLWEAKIDLDINPYNNYQVYRVGATMGAGNPNDETRLRSWPTTTAGSGSHEFSFGADAGADGGISASAGYTYTIDYTDITCVTQLVDGNINNYYWAFDYRNGSNPAKYSSYLDVGSRYNNSKGNFTLTTGTTVISRNNQYSTGSYRFSLADISVK